MERQTGEYNPEKGTEGSNDVARWVLSSIEKWQAYTGSIAEESLERTWYVESKIEAGEIVQRLDITGAQK